MLSYSSPQARRVDGTATTASTHQIKISYLSPQLLNDDDCPQSAFFILYIYGPHKDSPTEKKDENLLIPQHEIC